MVVKSRTFSDLLNDLKELLDILRAVNMKLNPKKCTFAVGAGKFLGYLVSKRGIEGPKE